MDTSRVLSVSHKWHLPVGVGLLGALTAFFSVVVKGGSLNGYGFDGGVYLGAATRLAHGTLPYKDFVFVQPPGVLLLLSPISVASWFFGTGFEVVAGRLLDFVLIGLACGLGTALLQRFGSLAAIAGGSFFALVGVTASVATQFKLEPPLIAALFAMLLVVFDGAERIAGRRRLLIGGLLGGVAVSLKLWALVPVAILLAVVVWRQRNALRPFLLGLVTSLGVTTLPFALASPRGFWRDVVVAQVGRSARGEITPGILGRIDYLAFYVLRPLAPSTKGFGFVLLFLLFLLGADAILRRRTLAVLEIVIYPCVGASLAMLLLAPVFSTYYAWYFAAFLALGVGASLRSPLTAFATFLKHRSLRLLGLGAALVLGLVFGLGQLSFTRTFVGSLHTPGSSSLVSDLVPSGACVLSNDAWVTLEANRFVVPPGCPALVDAKGEWLADSPGHAGPPGPPPPSVRSNWLVMLSNSKWVVLNAYGDSMIPWTPSMRTWFALHFRKAGRSGALTIFQRRL